MSSSVMHFLTSGTSADVLASFGTSDLAVPRDLTSNESASLDSDSPSFERLPSSESVEGSELYSSCTASRSYPIRTRRVISISLACLLLAFSAVILFLAREAST
jgi:hypothetical protein